MDILCIMLQTFLVMFVILSNGLHLVSLWIKDCSFQKTFPPPKIIFIAIVAIFKFGTLSFV